MPAPARHWILLLVLAALAAAVGAAAWRWNREHEPNATLIVINNSPEQVDDLTISYPAESFAHGPLRPGERREVRVHMSGPSRWSLSGFWPDGTVFSHKSKVLDVTKQHTSTITLLPGRKFEYTNLEIEPPPPALAK